MFLVSLNCVLESHIGGKKQFNMIVELLVSNISSERVSFVYVTV